MTTIVSTNSGENLFRPSGTGTNTSVSSATTESSGQVSSIRSDIGGAPNGRGIAPMGPGANSQVSGQMGRGSGPPNQGSFGYGATNHGAGYGSMGPGQMAPGPMNQGSMGMGQGQMNQGPMGQMPYGQMGHGPMGPGPMGPGQMGPGQMGPNYMGPGQMGPSYMGPGQMGPGPMGPGPMAAGPMGPGPMGVGPVGPGPMGPGPMGPGHATTAGSMGPSAGGPRTRPPTQRNNIMVPIRQSGPNTPRNTVPGYQNHPSNTGINSKKRSHDDGESIRSGFEADLNLKGQHIVQQRSGKIISIATRGIGFVTAVAYSRLLESNMGDLGDISVLSLYRAALAFLELKIYQAQKKRPKTKNDFSLVMSNLWKKVTVEPEFEKLVKIYSRSLPPIAAVINSIGNFSKDNSWYNVGLIYDHQDIAHPLTVTFSNLRNTVVRLSSKATPKEERKFFYDHNPIPGAIWSEDSDANHPLLLNADEIIPANYCEEKNFSALKTDLVNSVHAAELASAKKTRMWEDTLVRLDGDGMGNASLCASGTLKPLRIPNAPNSKRGSVAYPQITDRMMSMYTDIDLSPSERCLGILSLAGELDICQISDSIPQWAETRSPRAARFLMDCDWMFCASTTGIY